MCRFRYEYAGHEQVVLDTWDVDPADEGNGAGGWYAVCFSEAEARHIVAALNAYEGGR